MDTITIAIEDKSMMPSLRKVLSSIKGVTILGKSSNPDTATEQEPEKASNNVSRYKISPKVKSLECGFHCPEDLSYDYKEELSHTKIGRYQ